MNMTVQDKVGVLAEFPFFKNLQKNEIDSVAEVVLEKNFSDKDLLIEQNDNESSVFFIIKGQVKIYLLNENGKEINLAIVGPCETIGEISILVKGQRSAYCEAIGEVTALTLSGENFKALIEKNSKIAYGFLKYFAERIIKSNKHLEQVLTLNLKDRLWLLLESLVKSSLNKEIDITQETLANIMSATRPRVTEALAELEKDKKIKLSRSMIKVLSSS